jgi:hypothetical protein
MRNIFSRFNVGGSYAELFIDNIDIPDIFAPGHANCCACISKQNRKKSGQLL